jgi:hypothetical protein
MLHEQGWRIEGDPNSDVTWIKPDGRASPPEPGPSAGDTRSTSSQLAFADSTRIGVVESSLQGGNGIRIPVVRRFGLGHYHGSLYRQGAVWKFVHYYLYVSQPVLC